MIQDEILDDIRTIIQGQWANEFNNSGRMRVPSPNEIVPLLTQLLLRISGEKDRSFFWAIVQDGLENGSHGSSSEVQRLIYSEAEEVFELLVRQNKVDNALIYFNKERKADETFLAVLKKLVFLVSGSPEQFNKETYDKIDLIASDIIDQVSFEENSLEWKRLEKHVVTINGKILDVPLAAAPPKTKQKTYKFIISGREERDSCRFYASNLMTSVRKAKLNTLKREYSKENREVNQDRVVLQGLISKFGFDEKLNDSLIKIEKNLLLAEDGFDFKYCIDSTRSFLEELCVSIALKVEPRAGKKFIPDPVRRMNSVLSYLKSSGVDFLTDKEAALAVKLYGFLSDSGVHKLHSEKEYARISKNFGIEIGLFLAERLEKFLL